MIRTRSLRFVAGASAVSVASAVAAFATFRPDASVGLAWGAVGWGVMAAIGLASGAGLAAAYGRTGTGFLVAIVAGILSRLAATLGGALAAARAGRGALSAFLVGLGAGFVPLEVYEAIFFYRAGRRRTGPDGAVRQA
jgi:hypothetical protein